MRKTLALAIACAMLASMSSVAFADTTTDTKTIKVDETSAIYMLEDEDSNVLNKVDGSNLSLEPGDSFFIEILPENAGENIPTKLAGQYKVVTDWQTGKSSFESASITTKKVAEATGKYITKNPQYGLAASYDSLDALKAAVDAVKVEDNSSSSGAAAIAEVPLTEEQKAAVIKTYTQEFKTDYKYVAQINTKASYSTKEVDLNGTVKVVKKTSSNSSSASSVEVNAVVAYERANVDGDSLEVSKDAPVVTFDDVDGEVELTFGNNFTFIVNAKNQDELFLGYTEKPVSSIIDQNEDASIDFITFSSKPSFNRIGEFYIYADEDSYIYEVTENGLKKLNAKYDEDSSAYVFETRTLTSYAISDVELSYNGSAVEDDSSSSSSSSSNGGSSNGGSTTTKPSNPNTGSADMVSAAVAAAAVSLVAAGAAAYKKASKDEE
ncbi:hypothetical protein K370107A2_05320 [Merdimmobilis hominis]|uniref:Gram-positive cocci surface proteins LPxTG domain-containing protein n=1 Tax=uncultured Anaerotruncus sp. TaxID=905011 RepID=A0A6N2TKU3_9FIRM|nr:hypothetical protein [Merdimmobilis hominis]